MKNRKIMTIAAALALALTIAGCSNQLMGGQGTISISLNSGESPRVVVGQSDFSKLSYEIILTKGGHTIKETFPAGTKTASISAPVGNYVLTVRAIGPQEINNYTQFGPGDILLAIGEKSVTVRSGSNNAVLVQMHPAAEVENWAQLIEAIGQPYIPGMQEEIIIVKGILSFEPNSTLITIDRPIELRGESGAVINRGSSYPGSFFQVNGIGGTLTLKGPLTINGAGGAAINPLISVESGGTLIMHDGVFLQNNIISSPSGAVSVNGGTFTMYGGTIRDNKTTNNGGGVSVNGGTFIMTGGTIEKNEATTGSNGGGGVYIDGGTFTMNGGTISGNKQTNNNGNGGGGVYINSGTFNMTGGTIEKNVAAGSNGGGGVYMGSGGSGTSFTMSGGKISGNTATIGGGGGVCVNGLSSSFTMSGGTIYGTGEGANSNTAKDKGASLYAKIGDALYGDSTPIIGTDDNLNTTITGHK